MILTRFSVLTQQRLHPLLEGNEALQEAHSSTSHDSQIHTATASAEDEIASHQNERKSLGGDTIILVGSLIVMILIGKWSMSFALV